MLTWYMAMTLPPICAKYTQTKFKLIAMKTKHRFTLLVAAFSTLLSSSAFALPHLSIDLDSGRVLSSKQAFDAWHPASLTKLMTAYVVFKAIDAGEITTGSPVKISRNASRQPPSRIGFGRGSVITFDNALKLLIIKSANDISVAIAESLSGSTRAFANRMNREAARLGMKGSRFVNPHGLHDKRQVTTAHDIALLVRAIHKEYPQYAYMFKAPSLMAPQRLKSGNNRQKMHFSYNLLLERFRGGDGFKTGFVCASGYNFVGAATQGGRRIAAVVFGRDGQTSRAVDAAKLITEGFQLSLSQGTPISNLKANGAVRSLPTNMRSKVCTQEARAKRYDPGAGQAVIKSAWMQKRRITQKPLRVALGGASGPTSSAIEPDRVSRVTKPVFRPIQNVTATPNTTANDNTPIRGTIVASDTSVPIPRFRP